MVSVYSLLITLLGSIYFAYKFAQSFDGQAQKKKNNKAFKSIYRLDVFNDLNDINLNQQNEMMFQEQNDRFMQESLQQGLDSVTPWSMGGSDLGPDLAPGGFFDNGFDSFGGFGMF